MINHSYGSLTDIPTRLQFATSYKKNIVTVAAMDNKGVVNEASGPDSFGQGIIAVGATDFVGQRTQFSNMGKQLDIVAPGISLFSLSKYLDPKTPVDRESEAFADPALIARADGNEFNFGWLYSGCSFSAPQVTGAVSLMIGFNKKLQNTQPLRPMLFNDDIEHILKLSAYKGSQSYSERTGAINDIGEYDKNTWNQEVGYGRLNVRKALEFVQSGTLHHLHSGMAGSGQPYIAQTTTVSGSEVFFWDATMFSNSSTSAGLIVTALSQLKSASVKQHEVHQSVAFPSQVTSYPKIAVWGTGTASEMRGYSAPLFFDNRNQHLGLSWCTPAEVSSTGATFKTYIYEVATTNGTLWLPCTLGNVQMAYSVFTHPDLPVTYATNTTALAFQKGIQQQNETLQAQKRIIRSLSAQPNPFATQTALFFDIAESAFVTIEIVDALQRRVALLTEKHYAQGKYSLPFDASALTEGAYQARIRLTTDEGTSAVKTISIIHIR